MEKWIPILHISIHPNVKKHGLDRTECPTVVSGPAEAAGGHSVGSDPAAGTTPYMSPAFNAHCGS